MNSKIYAALSAAQGQIRGAVKSETNPYYKSKYADLEAVLDCIREPLSKNELSFVQSVTEGFMSTTIYHADGGQIVSLIPFVGQAADAQKLGSALTYHRRQGICTAFGVPQIDDDANLVATHENKQAPKKASPIPAGLLTDKGMPDDAYRQPNEVPSKPFDPLGNCPQTKLTKEQLESYGLEVEVRTLYPLFVEGRDNEAVKGIMQSNKLPLASLKKQGDALKKYLAETREETNLSDAVLNFFMENK